MIQGKTILITGGAGFVGNALAQKLKLKNTVYVLDDFSSSSHHPVFQQFCENNELNRIKFDEIFYTRGHTSNILSLLNDIAPDIIFHFGEFSRINESWNRKDEVYKSNLLGTSAVLDFCVAKKSFLVYSASSAILANSEQTQLQSTPYTFTKSVMVSMVKHYADWYGLKYVITYFYNVYGPGQIEDGPYATVLGIFEKCYKNCTKLPVVQPGTQSRIFTHINDITEGIIAALQFENKDIPIASNDECSIVTLAKLFVDESQIEFLPARKGDRTKSTKTLEDQLYKVGWKPKENLFHYIESVKKM